jgi:hypothetical protein
MTSEMTIAVTGLLRNMFEDFIPKIFICFSYLAEGAADTAGIAGFCDG